MTDDSVRISPRIVDIQVEDAWIIVDSVQERIYALNPTGSFLWAALKRGLGWQQAARGLALHMGMSEASVTADARAFVDALVECGLLTSSQRDTNSGSDVSGMLFPSAYVPPAIDLTLPLESRAGSPISHDPDPLLDPLSPLRLSERRKQR